MSSNACQSAKSDRSCQSEDEPLWLRRAGALVRTPALPKASAERSQQFEQMPPLPLARPQESPVGPLANPEHSPRKELEDDECLPEESEAGVAEGELAESRLTVKLEGADGVWVGLDSPTASSDAAAGHTIRMTECWKTWTEAVAHMQQLHLVTRGASQLVQRCALLHALRLWMCVWHIEAGMALARDFSCSGAFGRPVIGSRPWDVAPENFRSWKHVPIGLYPSYARRVLWQPGWSFRMIIVSRDGNLRIAAKVRVRHSFDQFIRSLRAQNAVRAQCIARMQHAHAKQVSLTSRRAMRAISLTSDRVAFRGGSQDRQPPKLYDCLSAVGAVAVAAKTAASSDGNRQQWRH